MTNTELLRAFLIQIKYHGILSSETIQAYQGDLTQFLNSIDYSVISIDALRIEKYYNWLWNHHNNQRTIARKMSSVRSFYNFLLFKGLVKNNPFRYIHFNAAQLLFSSKISPNYFRSSELRTMFQVINHDQRIFKWRNLVLFIALARMKIGIKGCLSLKLSQMDLRHRNLTLVTWGQKTRVHQFSIDFAKILKYYLKNCRTVVMNRFQRHHNYLLINYLGKPLTIRGVEYIFNQVVQASHINRPVSINMFRHPRPLHANVIQAYHRYFSRK